MDEGEAEVEFRPSGERVQNSLGLRGTFLSRVSVCECEDEGATRMCCRSSFRWDEGIWASGDVERMRLWELSLREKGLIWINMGRALIRFE